LLQAVKISLKLNGEKPLQQWGGFFACCKRAVGSAAARLGASSNHFWLPQAVR
jgi:hypothetical protein